VIFPVATSTKLVLISASTQSPTSPIHALTPAITIPSPGILAASAVSSPPVEAGRCAVCKGRTRLKCKECEVALHATKCGNDGLCPLCAKKSKIQDIRKAAKDNLKQQAERMKALSNKRFPPAHFGDNVTVKVPDVDRGRGDLRNIVGVIVEVQDDMYRVGNKDGTLKELFSRNQFTVTKEKFLRTEEVDPTLKGVRAMATKQSLSGGQGYERCHCNTKRATKRCGCRAHNKLCNSKCHNGLSCSNK
jgi:hypothetical protein